MIILDIGHSFIKAYDSTTQQYYKFNIEEWNTLHNFLITHQTKEFYIGCVNSSFQPTITSWLQSHGVTYHIITHDLFRNLVKINSKINFDEVGLDILSIVYYVADTNYLFVNNGTALVYFKYSHELDGVIIANNILLNTEQLMDKTHLSSNYRDLFDFGCNTSDAIAAGISMSFKQTLITLINKYKISKVCVNGIAPIYLQDMNDAQITYYDNPTLKGYIKLLQHLNLLKE